MSKNSISRKLIRDFAARCLRQYRATKSPTWLDQYRREKAADINLAPYCKCS